MVRRAFKLGPVEKFCRRRRWRRKKRILWRTRGETYRPSDLGDSEDPSTNLSDATRNAINKHTHTAIILYTTHSKEESVEYFFFVLVGFSFYLSLYLFLFRCLLLPLLLAPHVLVYCCFSRTSTRSNGLPSPPLIHLVYI